MTEYHTVSYEAKDGSLHVWEHGEKEQTLICDEVCDDGHCVGPDDVTSQRTISVRDLEVTRKGDTVTVDLIGVATEKDKQ